MGYHCVKCYQTSADFKWRVMLNMYSKLVWIKLRSSVLKRKADEIGVLKDKVVTIITHMIHTIVIQQVTFTSHTLSDYSYNSKVTVT